MEFKNTNPSAADFFRKYSDIVKEAEESEGDKAVDKDIKKLAKDQKKDVSDYKKEKNKDDKEDCNESSNYYKKMMGEAHEGFAAVEKSVAKNPKVRDPGAVAASIGRKKYGKEKFQKMAAAGKRHNESKELDEKWDKDVTLNPAKKGMFKGKSKADLEKQEKNLVKSGPHKKGSAENTKEHELNFAIRAKGGWQKGNESKDLDEKWEPSAKLNPAKKGTMPKSKAKVNSELSNLKKSGPHKKGSEAYTKEKELNFAKRAKSGWKESVKESVSYESSVDFEDDSSKVYEALTTALKVLSSQEWLGWMKETDNNYNPPRRVQSMSREIRQKLSEVQTMFDEMYNMMSDLG